MFIDSRRMRILVVIDDCTRECLALVSGKELVSNFQLVSARGPQLRLYAAYGRAIINALRQLLTQDVDYSFVPHYIPHQYSNIGNFELGPLN